MLEAVIVICGVMRVRQLPGRRWVHIELVRATLFVWLLPGD